MSAKGEALELMSLHVAAMEPALPPGIKVNWPLTVVSKATDSKSVSHPSPRLAAQQAYGGQRSGRR